jgi:hypothetical protein
VRAFALAASLAVAAATFVAVPAFATEENTCPTGTAAVSGVHYTVNGNPVTDLNQNNVHAGDVVKASFTIAPNCTDIQVTFAAYSVPPGGFDDKTLQVLDNHTTGNFSSGNHVDALQVTLPCSWQADLALGEVITQFSNNPSTYYGDRLIDHGTGTEECASPSPSPTESIAPATSTPNPGTPTPSDGQQSVLAAAVTNPNTGNGSEAFGGFIAVMMVLTGIAVLAEVRRRRLRD